MSFRGRKTYYSDAAIQRKAGHLYFQSVIEINIMLQFTLYYKKTLVERNSNVFFKYVCHRRETEKNNPDC